VALNGW